MRCKPSLVCLPDPALPWRSTAPLLRAAAAAGETETGGGPSVRVLHQHGLRGRCHTPSSLSDRVNWGRQTPARSDRECCRGRCQPPRCPRGRAARAGGQPGPSTAPCPGRGTRGHRLHLGDIVCISGTSSAARASICSSGARPGEPALPRDLINDCAAVCGADMQLASGPQSLLSPPPGWSHFDHEVFFPVPSLKE